MKKLLLMLVISFSLFSVDNVIAAEPVVQQDTFVRGKVINIIKELETEDQGLPIFRQELLVQLQSGEQKGKEVVVIYEKETQSQIQRVVKVGDSLVLGINEAGPETLYYISDSYRLNSLWLLLLLFLAAAVVFAGRYGFRAMLGLVFTFLIIGFFLIPLILDGKSPLLIGFMTAVAIACTALYIAHGLRVETTLALFSTIITLLLALGLGFFAVKIASLTGIGTEDAFYLQFAPGVTINLQGLLMAGIMLGVLGVLDDVTTAQTATIAQIHKANSNFDVKELYKRGLEVGREHIVSLVNTLVLAYTGAALPLLLLFQVFERPFWVTLNSEIIMEEIIRMLVGSISLILAVPITTLLASIYFSKLKLKHPI